MTYYDLLLVALAAIGIHRIWLYEDIFSALREWTEERPWLKSFWCPNCFAFWAAMAALLTRLGADLVPLDGLANPVTLLLHALAYYPLMRGLVWVYHFGLRPRFPTVEVDEDDEPARPEPDEVRETDKALPAAKCPKCDKAKALEDRIEFAKKFPRRVVMVTFLRDFASSYSITTVVIDQALALAAAGWYVEIWACEGVIGVPPALPAAVQVREVFPDYHWQDDFLDEMMAVDINNRITENLMPLGRADVITHDLLLVQYYLTAAKAMHIRDNLEGFRFFHQVHSTVGNPPDIDRLPRTMYRCRLPEGHQLICLTESERENLASYYQCSPDSIRVVPNGRDARWFFSMPPEANYLVTKYGLLDADVVQVFPVSSPRMGAKNLSIVLKILSHIKKRGKTVRLVVCNAHCTPGNAENMVTQHRKIAESQGLDAHDVVFTSEAIPQLANVGMRQETISALFRISNLFIFPSSAESYGLVVLEAGMSGNLLVLNSDVPAFAEVVPPEGALWYSFGCRHPNAPNRRSTGVNLGRVATEVIEKLSVTQALGQRAVLSKHSREKTFTALSDALTDPAHP